MTVAEKKTEPSFPTPLPCVHCGLATHVSDNTHVSENENADKVFCCNGCRAAYQLIHGWGLEDFYALRDQQNASGPLRPLSPSRFSPFDDDVFLGRSKPTENADGTFSTDLAIGGLHCAACVWLIENAAARTPGWISARVKMSDHTIRLRFDRAKTKLSEIARLIGKLGYELAPLNTQREDRFRAENRRLLSQIAIAAFCASNAMWIAIALYAGEATGVVASQAYFLRLIGTFLGLTAVAIPGRTFFVGAIASFRTRTPHMDLPVALGLSVGSVVGTVNAVLGSGDVYFDSLAILVFLLLLGRWVQFRQQQRAADAVDLLMQITPQSANRIEDDGDTRLVAVTELAEGDLIRIQAGEGVPVDGIVADCESTIDRSLLTGESVPKVTRKGDQVEAGTVNLRSPLTVSVQATGTATRIAKVMQSVEVATSQRTPIVQLADRIGGYFVVAVTILACIAFFVWRNHGIDVALSHATALLIVACPCALALATPLAIAIAIGHSAKRKILVSDGSVYQRLCKRGCIWFDKTGTLTEGRPKIEFLWGNVESLRMAASLESNINHPIATAILDAASQMKFDLSEDVDDVCVEFGGVTGRCEGHSVAVGSVALMNHLGVSISDPPSREIETCVENGLAPLLVAIDGVLALVLSVDDPLKVDALETVRRLLADGWQVGILSGDQVGVVHRVARKLGIDPSMAFGELSPEQKLARIKEHSDTATVMIGDGANDAAALAAADVGIAVRGGAEVSLRAAPVYIASNALGGIGKLMAASQQTTRLIKCAFAVSLSYNAVAVSMAVAGLISPLTAAVLMPISSVSILSLTLAWPIYRESDA